MGSAQAKKSAHLFPSILQEAFSPNILLFHCYNAGKHYTVGRSCFCIVSQLGKQIIPNHSFVPTSCHIFILEKVKLLYFTSRYAAPNHNRRVVVEHLIHLIRVLCPQIRQFCFPTCPDSEKLQ